MATSEVEVKRTDPQLKHLTFVRILAVNSAIVVSSIYDYAKQNSGPLKSAFGKVEDAVTAVVWPVVDRFKGVPDDVLVFLDKKVDEVTCKFDECAPPSAKSAMSKAQTILNKVSELVQDLEGPITAISHTGKISKDVTVNLTAIIWYKANQYPILHGAMEIVVPTAAHWSEKYNVLVKDFTSKGYSLFGYFPLIPVEEMEKAYKQVEAKASGKVDGSSSSESGSDKE